MNKDAETRRENLRKIVERDGLAVAARQFGKPDRQINDMIAGRKSFGEKVARDMEENYAPNMPAGWMSKPNADTSVTDGAKHYFLTDRLAGYESMPIPVIRPKTERDRAIERINGLLASTDDAGLAVVLDKAEEMSRQYPKRKSNA